MCLIRCRKIFSVKNFSYPMVFCFYLFNSYFFDNTKQQHLYYLVKLDYINIKWNSAFSASKHLKEISSKEYLSRYPLVLRYCYMRALYFRAVLYVQNVTTDAKLFKVGGKYKNWFYLSSFKLIVYYLRELSWATSSQTDGRT